MPKKAVAIFFLLAFIGAALFIFFTFPRTKSEIPTSNNQRPYPSSPGPNGVPIPETVPHPNTAPPHGPTLRVMAWASGDEAKTLTTEADAFASSTGRRVSFTIDGNPADYRRDLQDALAGDAPPDVCLIAADDFSGLDPARDLAEATPNPDTAPRSVSAFTVDGRIRAVPDEFSVDVLFYNQAHFDQAGIGYPDRHWTWDILEAISRALTSLKLKDASGQPVYPLELVANFNFWNILCTEAGHPALDLGAWHLTDDDTREAQMRALDSIHDLFHEFNITAPLPKAHEIPGAYFARQRASLLIASSEFAAVLPTFRYAFTLMPSDISRASLARVNGWAVMGKSAQPDAARDLAAFLARRPVHAGWSSVQSPAEGDTPGAICREALAQALIPRIEPKTAQLAQFLDQQIDLLARNPKQKTDTLYARIQTEAQGELSPPPVISGLPQPAGIKPAPKVEAAAQLRGF